MRAPALLTIPEAAEYLRVTPQTIYRLISQGELPRFKVGRSTRLRASDVYGMVGIEEDESPLEVTHG